MRIIAGKHRRRRLAAPEGDAIRPTGDRIRESLFSILGELHDTVVVDGYAGTGALGCEALSRGARKVWFIDSSRQAVELIQQNVAMLREEENAVVLNSPFARGLASVDEPVDVVFLDPPYHSTQPPAALAALAASVHVTDETLIVLEQDREEAPAVNDAFEAVDERVYGSTRLTFFRRVSPE